MKVAYVHDWLIVSGGAEKVTHEILKVWDADVFSLIDLLDDEDREFILHGKHATTSFIQKMPMVREKYRYYLPFFPKAIEQMDLSGYDLVLSASYAVAKGVKTSADQMHICYCHTPMRYAWDMQEDYLHQAGMSGGIKGPVLRSMLGNLRKWDKSTADRVNHYIANSANTAQRIRNHYDRSSEVIHPPVDMDVFHPTHKKGTHYLAAARLVPYKRMDLIVEAFNRMPEKRLVVIGDGPELAHLRGLANNNVEVKGAVSTDEIVQQMGSAQAMLLAANEDLGLTCVESHSCGTPTIALEKGGYLETVQDGLNGIFFPEQRVEDIMKAVQRFERDGVQWNSKQIRRSAEPFSSGQFRSKMKQFVEARLANV